MTSIVRKAPRPIRTHLRTLFARFPFFSVRILPSTYFKDLTHYHYFIKIGGCLFALPLGDRLAGYADMICELFLGHALLFSQALYSVCNCHFNYLLGLMA